MKISFNSNKDLIMKNNVLSIVTIIILAFAAQNMFAQEMTRHNKVGHQFSMFQKLNLTDAQKDQITKLRLNNKMQMVDLKANLEKKKIEMMELKNNGNYTREQYISKVEAINQAKNEIAISKANFQMDVYQLLDDTQKVEWNKYSQFMGERKEKRMMRQMKETHVD